MDNRQGSVSEHKINKGRNSLRYVILPVFSSFWSVSMSSKSEQSWAPLICLLVRFLSYITDFSFNHISYQSPDKNLESEYECYAFSICLILYVIYFRKLHVNEKFILFLSPFSVYSIWQKTPVFSHGMCWPVAVSCMCAHHVYTC